MIHIALVEDEEEYRKEFLSYLRRYEQESGRQFRISVFSDGEDIVSSYKADYDLILMDIAMRFMDGMTAAEKIRELDQEVVIIFITNMPQFVMKGYAVDALDYVLKPVNYFAFSQRIERAISRMSRRREQYFTVPVRGGIRKLSVSNILYVEVQDHDLLFHTRNESILTRGSLAEVEAKLGNAGFFRCNKYCLVNLAFADSLQGIDLVVAGEHIQVSRAKKKAVLDALNNYLNEVSK
jgi:DNA-binding LytR/AlgR family response regulator